MTLDVAAEVRESSQNPPNPEKRKWGFTVQRDTDSVNTLARFFSTTTAPNATTTDPNYQRLKELTQMQCAQDPELASYKTREARDPGGVLSLLQQRYEGFSDTENMDRITYLTNLTDMFDFATWNKGARLYNFSDKNLTDEQLFQIGDAIGEMNNEFGGGPMDYLSSIVIVPDGHPILWSNGRPRSDSTSIFDDKMIVVNAKFLESRRLPVQRTSDSAERSSHAGGNTLKALIKHEFGHLWGQAHDERLQNYERNTRGETPPTKYAEMIDRDTGRPLEDFPETLVADTHPRDAAHIGPVHGEELRSLRADTHPGTAGPTIVTCRQLNPESFVKLSSAVPRGHKFWMPRWASPQESFTYSTVREFEEAALEKLETAQDSTSTLLQDFEKGSKKVGQFRLPDGNILRITHLAVDKPDEYIEGRRVYPREDIIVEVIYNSPDAKDICRSEGLRMTRRRDSDYEKIHVQWVTSSYERSESEGDWVFKPLPGVSQYKVDFSDGPPKDKDIKEMMKLLK